MLQKRSVLVVEDEFLVADKVTALLSANGYAILPPAASYEEAVSLLKSELPDVALLDINLNGKKDGIELAGYIYRHFHIPVIFLSGLTDAETIRRAKAAHANMYVIKSKPLLDEENLLRTMEQILVSVAIALPEIPEKNKRKTLGLFYKVKEIDLSRRRATNKETDPVDKEMLLRYDDISFIESNNQFEKNTVLIHTIQAAKGFVLRSTMREIEDDLPENFLRVHDSFIINLHKVTARRLPFKLYISDTMFAIGEKYREHTIEKVNLILGL